MASDVGNVGFVRKIITEINEEIENTIGLLKVYVCNKRDFIRNKKDSQKYEIQILEKEIMYCKERDTNFMKEKEFLIKSIENEKKDLECLKKEKCKLSEQVCCNEEKGKHLSEKVENIKNKLEILTKKIDFQERKNAKNEKEIENEISLYKKFLGIDIFPIKNNFIKILFKNVGEESFIVMEFGSKISVVEVFPIEIGIEAINSLFYKISDFKEFLKETRNLFIQFHKCDS
ncbi:hypothetical protein CWI38_1156p0020 [Hamiltosporidium tvaerminnensis]|uniref:Kinetochore protein SPC25 n=1 Tax=Hamiltosporidium tvaerminnensis TaxID=1176355 RepID=A0A4Q9L522_9MICR|nr:hypothetical protein CWI37_0436p0030 [Hamiltosporidium tvaerminnensis]TBU11529.1 hypothetical protein CWI38_1156p0020 [Hamiltosporidium tvaerminnensis]